MNAPRIVEDADRQAYHEAGHAVLGFLGGLKIKSVAIGFMITRKGFAAGMTNYYTSKYCRLGDYESDLYRSLGGARAEIIHLGGVYLPGLSGDLKTADKVYVEYVEQCERLGTQSITFKEAWKTAGSMLASNWYLVEAIAEQLKKKERLSGASVVQIIRGAVFERHSKDPQGSRLLCGQNPLAHAEESEWS